MGILDGILSAIPVIGPFISGAASFFGQESANESNQQIAQQNSAFNASQSAEARAFNAAEAQKNRDFQMNMSDTAYQRAVAGMKDAGLNPMLAYSQGGASTPTGSQASGPAAQAVQPAAMGNAAGAGVASAAQAATIENIKAQTDKTRAETRVVETQFPDSDDRTQDLPAKSYTAEEQRQRAKDLQRAASIKLYNIEDILPHQKDLVIQEVKNAAENNRRIKADTRDTTANAILRELAQAEARSSQAFQLKYPDYARERHFIKDAGSITNSAGAAARSFLRR